VDHKLMINKIKKIFRDQHESIEAEIIAI